ncbi:hypothetical protein JCM6292_1966 [Bacteroides pyogenes JCM 6292]|uniref:Uncharacterized protein n=2 Tax=Bacteroides pyogenes TaxID=310300 RepID=W4PJF9_9BACE|nr:hypothetical protein JCM6292_1966 [Bacteroides pyogenes JCM 6292]GAE19553.1 hypothetical protein JCM6294_2619 [Bacteroides pyogenes DSM 20611 = JCM 6294]
MYHAWNPLVLALICNNSGLKQEDFFNCRAQAPQTFFLAGYHSDNCFLPLCQSFYPDSFLFSSFFSILRELSSEIAYSLQS